MKGNMKKTIKFPVILMLLFCVKIVYYIGCAASQNLNDFFGIEMDESEADQFRIVSYEKDRGANYYSNSQMNTQLYAWAEVEPQIIRIKIVNLTNLNIPINYNMDQFTVFTTDDKEYILIKGDRIAYPSEEYIAPHQSVEYSLEIPMKFWQTVGLTNPNATDANYVLDFWKGENSLQIVKGKVRMIKVFLGGKTTLIMKPVP